jgi:hypothetical protein
MQSRGGLVVLGRWPCYKGLARFPAWLVAGENGDALLAAAEKLAQLRAWLDAGDHGDAPLATAGGLAHLRRHR